MANITLAIPEELYAAMKKYNEIRWSEVAKKAIESCIHRLKLVEKMEQEKMLDHFDEMFKNSELTEDDVAALDEKVKQGLQSLCAIYLRGRLLAHFLLDLLLDLGFFLLELVVSLDERVFRHLAVLVFNGQVIDVFLNVLQPDL